MSFIDEAGDDPTTQVCFHCKKHLGLGEPFTVAIVARERRFWSPPDGHAIERYNETVYIHLSHMIGTGGAYIPLPSYYDPRIDGPRG